MRLIFRLFALVGLLFTILILAVIGFFGYLLVAGESKPPDCATPPGNAIEQVNRSLAFDAKLAAFLATGGRPPVASVSFDEGEAAARASRYFGDQSDRFSDVSICFEQGEGRGFLRVNGFGRRMAIAARGSIDLSGEHPRLDLSSASVAGLALPGPLRSAIESGINDELSRMELSFPLQIGIEPDRASLTRVP